MRSSFPGRTSCVHAGRRDWEEQVMRHPGLALSAFQGTQTAPGVTEVTEWVFGYAERAVGRAAVWSSQVATSVAIRSHPFSQIRKWAFPS